MAALPSSNRSLPLRTLDQYQLISDLPDSKFIGRSDGSGSIMDFAHFTGLPHSGHATNRTQNMPTPSPWHVPCFGGGPS
jgi:hypothetical protein